MGEWDQGDFRKSVRAKFPILTSRLIVNANGQRFNRGTVEDELLDKYKIIQYYKLKE